MQSPTPTRFSAAIFRGKATLLQARRAARDVAGGVMRFPCGSVAEFPRVVAESRSPLWSADASAETLLQMGKVCNLRCAVRALNGTRLPGGGTFSFWKQIGRATRRRGYAAGRLLREGCLMPAIGGGLCQLSNALYQVALDTSLEIVERWGHSSVVPGSAAQCGRDATVAWNYIDLRFRVAEEIAIEAFLTADELVVRLRGRGAASVGVSVAPNDFVALASLEQARPRLDAQAHSCASCAQTRCFRHQSAAPAIAGRRAFLVDECWPEFQSFVAQTRERDDVLAVPLDGARWHQARYSWDTGGYSQIHAAMWATLKCSWRARRLAVAGAVQIAGAEALARRMARALTPDVTRVVVAQSLLPFLWRDGHLGGRTIEVLVTRLPLHVLHARLDAAARLHPERTTLREFRAPAELVEAERAALRNARVVTPHAEVAALFGERATLLEWHLPAPRQCAPGRAIAFAGPVAARKGAHEVRGAARELELEVVLRGSELEGADFWRGVTTRRPTQNWLDGALAVVQPALVEDQPRVLLQALAAGVPVIATRVCGLAPRPGLTLIEAGNQAALVAALREIQART